VPACLSVRFSAVECASAGVLAAPVSASSSWGPAAISSLLDLWEAADSPYGTAAGQSQVLYRLGGRVWRCMDVHRRANACIAASIITPSPTPSRRRKMFRRTSFRPRVALRPGSFAQGFPRLPWRLLHQRAALTHQATVFPAQWVLRSAAPGRYFGTSGGASCHSQAVACSPPGADGVAAVVSGGPRHGARAGGVSRGRDLRGFCLPPGGRQGFSAGGGRVLSTAPCTPPCRDLWCRLFWF
jgi:hypothetical protein